MGSYNMKSSVCGLFYFWAADFIISILQADKLRQMEVKPSSHLWQMEESLGDPRAHVLHTILLTPSFWIRCDSPSLLT